MWAQALAGSNPVLSAYKVKTLSMEVFTLLLGVDSNGKGVGETGVSTCRKVLKTERLSGSPE